MQTAFRSEERFTQEEFWQWLQERPASDINHYELIRGRIVMTPPAGWPHGLVESILSHLVVQHAMPRELGYVLGSSTGFDLPSGDTLEPDLSFVSRERWGAAPPPVRGRFLRVVPDLAVEILSDSTARRDRTEKRDIYAENGAREYWLVDTDRREVTVLHAIGGAFDVGEAIALGRLPSRGLPDLGLDVSTVFAEIP